MLPYICARRNKVAVNRYGDWMQSLTQQLGSWPRALTLTPDIARVAGDRTLRLFVVAGFALTLAACDKCSVPVWRHDTPAAPQSCHDDAPAR